MKEILRDAVLRSFERLVREDGCLFDCTIEEHSPCYDARKLHEVCLNHRLANYLETALLPLLAEEKDRMFVDIEFNREGMNSKSLRIEVQDSTVRPDIIVHNRKSGDDRGNYLVVECKKSDAPKREIEEDRDKIRAFMEDKRYEYSFGLQVLYARDRICGTLFFKRDGSIDSERLHYCQPAVGV